MPPTSQNSFVIHRKRDHSDSEMTNSLIVKAYGRRLDELRSAASRITRDQKFDWSVEGTDKGVRFSFEDARSKNIFAAFCTDLGVSYIDVPSICCKSEPASSRQSSAAAHEVIARAAAASARQAVVGTSVPPTRRSQSYGA